jgi:hypothetical protein
MATTTKTKTRAEVVKELLGTVEAKMAAGELKATLGDYIRLLQMEKEMGLATKTELKVTWIEEPETTQRE